MAALVYRYTKELEATYLSFEAWLSAIGSEQRSIIIAIDTQITSSVTVPNNVDIVGFYNGSKFTGNGSLTINKMSCDPQHQIFASTLTVTINNKVVRPIWFEGNSINRALNALPVDGGTIQLENMRYDPVLIANFKDNVRLLGRKQPVFNDTDTGLTDGTIIDGPFIVEHDNIEIRDLGVDSGVTVCNTRYAGAAQDAFGTYNAGSIVGKAQKRVHFENITAICKESTSLFHAIIAENIKESFLKNLRARFGTHGIVIKGTDVTGVNFYSSYNSSDGLIIKHNDYAPCSNVSVSGLVVQGNYGGGAGLAIDGNVMPSDFMGVSVTGIVVKECTVGVLVYAGGNPNWIRHISLLGVGYGNTSNVSITGNIDFENVNIAINSFSDNGAYINSNKYFRAVYGLELPFCRWNDGNNLKLGAYRLWVDGSGLLRMKNGDPTADNDGVIVGTQS